MKLNALPKVFLVTIEVESVVFVFSPVAIPVLAFFSLHDIMIKAEANETRKNNFFFMDMI
jgi:hypothetical protein